MRRVLIVATVLLMAARVAWPLAIELDAKGHLVIARPEGIFAVDVSGGAARLLAKPQTGRPVLARPSPDGTKVLVVESLDAEARKEKKASHELFLVDAVGGGAKSLGAFYTVGHVAWSPNSARVSASVLGEKKPHLLRVITLADGKVTTLTGAYRSKHDWINADEIAAVTYTPGRAEVTHRGKLVRIDVTQDKVTQVAEVECGNRTAVDVSPDGTKVLVITRARDKDPQLTVVTLDGGSKLTLVPEDVRTAAWSPDSKRIALIAQTRRERKDAVDAPGGLGGGGGFTITHHERFDQVLICDADGLNPKGVADKPAVRLDNRHVVYFSADLGDELLQPTWLDRHTVLYFYRMGVYGDAGTALHLMSVSYNGTGRKDLQLVIDKAIAEALK